MLDSFLPRSLKSLALSWLLSLAGCAFAVHRFGSLFCSLRGAPLTRSLSINSISRNPNTVILDSIMRFIHCLYCCAETLIWPLRFSLLIPIWQPMRSLHTLVCWYIYLMYFLLYDVFTYVLSHPGW